MNKAIFLDRDGTINVDKKYLHKIEDFEFLPGVLDGMKMLQNALTNPGLGVATILKRILKFSIVGCSAN